MTKTVFTSVPVEEIEDMINRAVHDSLTLLLKPQSQTDPDELLTRKTAAQMLGISLPTLHDYNKRGVIPCYKIGTRVRYKKGEILDCLQKVRTQKYKAA